MLAINVLMPNLTVARLEQFRNYESRESDEQTRVGWKQTVLYTKASCRYLPSESICSKYSLKIGCHGNVP